MTPRLRLLGLALVAAGLWALRGELVGDDLASPATPRPAAAPATPRLDAPNGRAADAASAAARPALATREPLAMREPLAAALRDPFSRPRQAARPAAAASAPVVAVPVAPAVAVAPSAPPPPRVPYRFIGLMSEGGRPTSVFLALGEQLLQARPGDLLEGGYQLKSIATRELVFTHPQLNLTVRMPVDGETS